jgi:class 3 adenylate cyclase
VARAPALDAGAERGLEGFDLIGIHTRPLLTGNVAGGGRATYTVHGDTVNLAARLEALNKEPSTTLLVSASTARELPDVRFASVGFIALRGLHEAVAHAGAAALRPERP